MHTYAYKKNVDRSPSGRNTVSQQSNKEANLQFADNRPMAVTQRKLKETMSNSSRAVQLKSLQTFGNSSVIQRYPFDENGNDLGATKKPQVREIYGSARGFFGRYGSPQIKGIHKSMEEQNHPLLDQDAGFFSGWEAGQHENKELMKLPASEDWRDEKFAKHPMAMFLRPSAAALTGTALKSMYYMTEGMREDFARKTGRL